MAKTLLVTARKPQPGRLPKTQFGQTREGMTVDSPVTEQGAESTCEGRDRSPLVEVGDKICNPGLEHKHLCIVWGE